MNESIELLLSLAAGSLLGVVFFGGLWLTLSLGLFSKNPVLWFVISWLLRMGIVLLGFYLVSQGQLDRLLACFVGFIVMKIIITKSLKPRENLTALSKPVSHD